MPLSCLKGVPGGTWNTRRMHPSERVSAQADARDLEVDAVLRHEGLPPSQVSTSMARHAVETRQALFFSSGSPAHATLRNAPSVSLNRIQSAVYVPLIGADDEVLGLLCVDTPQPTAPIQPADFHFIRAVGALLTAALHADHMREEARRREMEARDVAVRRDAMANSLRIAAHDLKTPLTVITLAAQALTRIDDPALRRELVGEVSGAAMRAKALIETYLDAAAAEDTARVVLCVAVDPRAMVDEEIRFLQASRVDQPAIAVTNAVACRSVLADPSKLSQVFGNLLSNAAKYSPNGGEIRVESEEDAKGITFRVVDRGVGIPAHEVPRLFEPFERLPETAATEGTGLGLWLTRGLVEAHGGRIWVESVAGRGSVFSIWLPRG